MRGTVAFDLDGTLLTCEPRQSAVLRAALRRAREFSIDPSAVWRRKREGASTQAALVAEGLLHSMAENICGSWLEMIEGSVWLSLDQPFPGVRDALANIKSLGCRLVLLSGRRQPHLAAVELQALRLRSFFDEFLAVHPANASAAKAEHLRRLRPLVFFGDTESDARAAASAGTPMLAVASGQRSEDFLRRSGVGAIYPGVPEAVRAWEASLNQVDAR
jgi:phosphoglycolate phosphatase-like HAD superfamily hydrolase